MGLDIVEFVMDVEEAFGIYIPDDVAAELHTAGDLRDYLREVRGQAPDSGCLSSSRFYRLRRALCEQTGLDRREIAPGTSLESLLPRHGRRRRWYDLQVAALPLRLPRLAPPSWWVSVVKGIVTLYLIGVIGLMVCIPARGDAPLVVALVLGIAGLSLMVWIKYVVSRELPWEAATMRDLVHGVLGANTEAARLALQRFNDHDIWEQIRTIVGHHFHVDPSGVTPEFDFSYGRGPG